jgi:hypothetical protein
MAEKGSVPWLTGIGWAMAESLAYRATIGHGQRARNDRLRMIQNEH